MTQIDGDFSYSRKERTLVWILEEISEEREHARLVNRPPATTTPVGN